MVAWAGDRRELLGARGMADFVRNPAAAHELVARQSDAARAPPQVEGAMGASSRGNRGAVVHPVKVRRTGVRGRSPSTGCRPPTWARPLPPDAVLRRGRRVFIEIPIGNGYRNCEKGRLTSTPVFDALYDVIV